MPRYTRAWVAKNPALFLEHSTPGSRCEICFDDFTSELPARGPIQGQAPTGCRHFFCSQCWREMMARPNSRQRCPMCRENCSTWLLKEFPAVLPRVRRGWRVPPPEEWHAMQPSEGWHVLQPPSSSRPTLASEEWNPAPPGHPWWVPYHPILDRKLS